MQLPAKDLFPRLRRSLHVDAVGKQHGQCLPTNALHGVRMKYSHNVLLGAQQVGDEFDDFERRSLSEVSRDIPWFGGGPAAGNAARPLQREGGRELLRV